MAEAAPPLPPSQPWQQKNLRPLWQFLRPGIAIDRAVDGHRDALLDPGLDAGILFSQFPEQLPYVLGFDLDLALAAGELAQRTPERDFDHQPPRSASIAARTRGGDIGMWVMRTPAAF